MKRTLLFLILILLTFSFIVGCTKPPEPEPEPIVEEPEVPSEIPEEQPLPEPDVTEPEGIPSPLSGVYADEEEVNRRIMAVVFDNHPAARWQSGLKDAEVVFEYPVEGSFTRYIGLYLINHPDYQIGPIRSARPYLVTKSYEFDAIFVHVGGSEAAKADVRNLKLAEIDGLTSSSKVFWRNKNKKAPNNLYTSMDVLREVQEDKGFRETSEYDGFTFADEGRIRTGSPASRLDIIYNKSNSTVYEYDPVAGDYIRYKDGKPHIDESDGIQLRADNIIIQRTGIKVLDNEGRLGITMEGSGSGYYVSQGFSEEISWKKSSRSDKTYYYNLEGDEIELKPGKTWIQIIGSSTAVNME